MGKQMVKRYKNYRISTFKEYKEMHDFIMSLNLNNDDELTLCNDDDSFTYGIDVAWLEEETDREYYFRIEQKRLEKELEELEKAKKRALLEKYNELTLEDEIKIGLQKARKLNSEQYSKLIQDIKFKRSIRASLLNK